MAITASEINDQYLADFGEPVVIVPGDDNEVIYRNKPIQAVVIIENQIVAPLDGSRQSGELFMLHCKTADISGVDSNCCIAARGFNRNVIEILPPDNGLSLVLLGDAWSEE